MQERLLTTQQSMEKEFWKLRELETRYNTLVNASADAVLVLQEPDFTIIDTNENASRMFGLQLGDKITNLTTSQTDTTKITTMLATTKQSGRAPLTLINIGADHTNWQVRTSSYLAQNGLQYVVQFSIHKN